MSMLAVPGVPSKILLVLPLSGAIVWLEPKVCRLFSVSPNGVSELLLMLPYRKRLPPEPLRLLPDLTCLLRRVAALKRDGSIVYVANDWDSSVMTNIARL